MDAIGEVVRLAWRSREGKVILVAVTPDYREFSRKECDEHEVQHCSENLHIRLERHAARQPASTTTPEPTHRLALVR
jgi:hypothetical protein